MTEDVSVTFKKSDVQITSFVIWIVVIFVHLYNLFAVIRKLHELWQSL